MATLAALLLVAGLLPATGAAEPEADSPQLLVLAASSLTAPMKEVAAAWESQNQTSVKLSFGGSSRLATQISQGARADVFLSANRKWVEHLTERELVDPTSRTTFASNRLVWVVPSGASEGPDDLETIRQSPPERLALGGPKVPAGMYARRALRSAEMWSGLEGRVVSAENVKRALQWVALGEAEAGIVYRTDAIASDEVDVAFELPERLQPEILYEGAVPGAAEHPELGRAFLEFLGSPKAREILGRAGFSEPPSGEADLRPEAPRDDSGVDEASAIELSLIVGLACVLCGLLPAILLGWLLARRQFRGKSLVATLLLSPIALPPVVTGFILLRLFGRSGILGPALASVGLQVPFTTLGAGLAAFVVAFPLYLLTARSAFELVDRRYEEVSMTLGYRPRSTF